MQETITFPKLESPCYRFTFSQTCYCDCSQGCSPMSSPFVSAPSSPGKNDNGGFYFSAPTSPRWNRNSEFITKDRADLGFPLHWEENAGLSRRSCDGKNKSNNGNNNDESGPGLSSNSDFEFSARFAELDDPSMSPTPMSSANELFCNGQIKPLKLPPRLDQQQIFTSNRIRINQPVHCIQNTLSEPSDNRSPGGLSPSSSVSAPTSPRFTAAFACITGSSMPCGIPHNNNSNNNKGRSSARTSSISAPQTPRSPLNRVKEALCVSSKIDNAFNSTLDMARPADEATRCLDEAPRRFRETSRCQKNSRNTGSVKDMIHRRTRSFSPLRMFHRAETDLSPSPSLSPSKAVPSKENSSIKQNQNPRKLTLKDLLHQKSIAENRSESNIPPSFASSSSASSSSSSSTRNSNVIMQRNIASGRPKVDNDSIAMANKARALRNAIANQSEKSRAARRLRSPKPATANVLDSRSRVHMAVESASSSVIMNAIAMENSARALRYSPVRHEAIANRARVHTSMECVYSEPTPTSCLIRDAMAMSSSPATSVMHDVMAIAMANRGKSHSQGRPANHSHTNTVHNVNRDKTPSPIDTNSFNAKAKISTPKSDKGPPHELHYQGQGQGQGPPPELSKKTFLPYRHGLLGCLGFSSKSFKTISAISKALQSVSG